MLLTPTERDRLLIFTAAQLARVRRARGLRLNLPEATAVVADTVCEAARDGARHAEALAAGRAALGPDDVLPGVADVLDQVSVEAVFDDGTRLVVVPDPIGGGHLGDDAPGAVLPPAPANAPAPTPAPAAAEHAGPDGDADGGLDVVRIDVVNTASVAVSVSSHFHFFEANPRLRFDRAAAYGRHLRMPAGSTVRFDPGATVAVELVPFTGRRVIVGFSGLVDGPLDAPGAPAAALERARAFGYLGAQEPA